jgi:hypothetical protein
VKRWWSVRGDQHRNRRAMLAGALGRVRVCTRPRFRTRARGGSRTPGGTALRRGVAGCRCRPDHYRHRVVPRRGRAGRRAQSTRVRPRWQGSRCRLFPTSPSRDSSLRWWATVSSQPLVTYGAWLLVP